MGLFTSATTKIKKQEEADERLAQFQAKLDQEQSEWNYLNSASLQKQGMRNAGLSTAGFGSDSSQAGSMESVSMPNIAYPAQGQPFANVAGGLGQFVNMAKGVSDYRLNMANTMKSKAQVGEIGARTENISASTANIKVDTDFAKQTLDSRVAQIGLQNENLYRQNVLSGAQLRRVNQEIDNMKASLQQINIDNAFKPQLYQKNLKQLDAQIENILIDNKLKPLLARSQMALQSAQAYNQYASGDYSKAMTEGKNIENKYSAEYHKLMNQELQTRVVGQNITNAINGMDMMMQSEYGISGSRGLWGNIFGFLGRLGSVPESSLYPQINDLLVGYPAAVTQGVNYLLEKFGWSPHPIVNTK